MIYPSTQIIEPTKIVQTVDQMQSGDDLNLHIRGENFEGKVINKMVLLQLGQATSGSQRIEEIGLELRTEKNRIFVDMVEFDSPAEKAGIDFDWEILGIKVPTDRPVKQWMYLPAFLLLFFIIVIQSMRLKEKKLNNYFISALIKK